MDQGMTRIKVHATEEHRDGRMGARERHHSSMKDAQSSGEQAEAVGQEIGRSKVHANEENAIEITLRVRKTPEGEKGKTHQPPASVQRRLQPSHGR